MRVQQYSIAHCHPRAHVQAATTDGVVVTGDMAMHAFRSLLACRLVAKMAGFWSTPTLVLYFATACIFSTHDAAQLCQRASSPSPSWRQGFQVVICFVAGSASPNSLYCMQRR